MSVADNVKRLRKEKGWTQVRLSMEAHVSQQAISFIESGRNEPSTDMIRALSKALGVSSSEIIGDNSQTNADELSAAEVRLLTIYKLLNYSGQDFLLAQAESILQQSAFRKVGSTSSAI